MVPIHTHPPSKEYDEGWDRIFGKKSAPEQDVPEHGTQDNAPADPDTKRHAPDTD
jgi:hypothetical protein